MDSKTSKNKLTIYQKKIVKNYIKVINDKITVNGVLLYGSNAYGKPTKHSDVDLVIISSDFKKQNFFRRIDWLTRQRINVADTIAMDIIGYTPQEFSTIEKESAIMAKAKKDGKWLFRK